MAQDRTNPDEEYRFSDYESSSEVFPSGLDEEQPQRPQGAAKRNLLVGISIIAVIVLVYKLLGFLFTPKTPGAQRTQVPAVMQLKPPAPQSVPLDAFAQSKPMPQQMTVPAEITDKLAKLEQQSDTTKEQVEVVQTTLTNLDKSISSVNQKLKDIEQSIKDTNDKIVALQVKPKSIIKKPRRFLGYWPGYTQYFVQAVVPGRAWLMSKNGTTITVRQGTLLPGYGHVVRIDTQSGQVMTSSGMIIRFRPSDL